MSATVILHLFPSQRARLSLPFMFRKGEEGLNSCASCTLAPRWLYWQSSGLSLLPASCGMSQDSRRVWMTHGCGSIRDVLSPFSHGALLDEIPLLLPRLWCAPCSKGYSQVFSHLATKAHANRFHPSRLMVWGIKRQSPRPLCLGPRFYGLGKTLAFPTSFTQGPACNPSKKKNCQKKDPPRNLAFPRSWLEVWKGRQHRLRWTCGPAGFLLPKKVFSEPKCPYLICVMYPC